MHKALSAALVAAFVISSPLLAQGVLPAGQVDPNAQPLANVAQFAVPALDRVTIEAEDDLRAQQGLPPRYAIVTPVAIDQATHGTWEVLDNAWSLWRVRISAPDSSHVNFGFSDFKLPPTGRLMIYDDEYSNVLRPFDAADHSPEGQLWTPVVDGSEMVIELYVQTAQRPQVRLALAQVGSGYRFFGAGPHAVRDGGSGSCNVDVNCSQGNSWVNEIPSVAAISSGGGIFCTGFMVNNTAQDATPYFMTANHCGVSGNPSSLVCYWNYERAVCGSGSGSLSQFTTGAQLRSTYSTSDFTLVRLNSSPNAAWGVTFAGWNRGTGNASSAVGIHHPSGDDKKISFENQATTTTSYGGTSQPGNGSHVRVIDWDTGTTEGGSSGSPLFDQNHRVIGQLHGGGAACGNNQSDWYGRFSMSWTGGGSSSNRLSNWLDPIGTNQTTLDTLGSNSASASTYGVGCYQSYATFFETFGNGAFDMSGTASTAVSIVMTPGGNGYTVANGGNVWSNPTTGDLNLGDDAVTGVLNLGFTLSFPGGSTSQVRMCSNGYVWLNGSSTGADYTETIGELCSQPPRLAPFWMDLNPAGGGTTHFHTSAGAAYFTWLNVPPYGSTSPTNSLQAVVRSTGVVEYRWRSVTNMPGEGLVGWSRGNGVAVPPELDISSSLPFSISVDANGLDFAPVGTPVQGTTMTMLIGNIPAGSLLAGVFFGWQQYPNGLSLGGIGMPGCFQYGSQDFSFSLLTGGASTVPFQIGIPTGAAWDGTHMYAQAAALLAGVNQLGALSSNGIDLRFAPN